MIRLSLLLLLMLGSIHGLNAQAKATYHVNTKTLLLKSAPRSKAKTLKELMKYDNLTLRQSKANKNWVKVQVGELEGYVATESIASGEAVVTYSEERTGAECKDGTSSKAKGRGACSHHGGVKRWKTKRKQNVTIIDNQ